MRCHRNLASWRRVPVARSHRVSGSTAGLPHGGRARAWRVGSSALLERWQAQGPCGRRRPDRERARTRQARQVIVRVELPGREGAAGPPSLVVLRLDCLSYSGGRELGWNSACLHVAARACWHACRSLPRLSQLCYVRRLPGAESRPCRRSCSPVVPRAGCAAAAAADGAAAAADDGAAVRLQKQVTFSGLTVELFEDLDEGPDPPEPDAASFSQVLAPGAAEQPQPARAASGGAGAAAEEAHSVVAAPAPSAASTEPTGSERGERCEGAEAGLGPCSPDEPDAPAGSSETDGWDEDVSPFELLPGMPGCDAGNPGPAPPGPGCPAAPRRAQAPPPSPAQAPASPPRSSAAGSGDAGGARHVVICSAEGAGCAGELRVALAWRTPAQPHPTVRAELTLEPLQARAGARRPLRRPCCVPAGLLQQ